MTDRDRATATERRRACYLLVSEVFNLNHMCVMLRDAGFSVYLVGSSLMRPDYRDVDVRAILDDAEFDAMFTAPARLALLNTSVSEWLSARTGLPVDFQFQRQTDANRDYPGERNAMGLRVREWG